MSGVLPCLAGEEKPEVAAPAPAPAPLLGIVSDRESGTSRHRLRPSSRLQDTHEDKLVTQRLVQKPCEIPSTAKSTFLMAFSGDGSRIASTHGDHNIYVTDAGSGRLLNTLRGHPRSPWCVAFHPTNSQLIASGCLGGEVRVWDLHGGSERWQADATHVIASLAFHPVDHVLVIATGQHLYFWNWLKAEPFVHCSTLRAKERLRYVKFDPLGFKLITAISNVSAAGEGLGPLGGRAGVTPHSDRLPAGAAADPAQPGVSPARRSLESVHRSLTRRYDQLHAQYLSLRGRRDWAEQQQGAEAEGDPPPPVLPPRPPPPPPPLPPALEPAAHAGLELARQYARQVTAAAAAPGDMIADLEADSREMLSWAHGVMDSLSDIIADIRPDASRSGVLAEPVLPSERPAPAEAEPQRRSRGNYTSGWDVPPSGGGPDRAATSPVHLSDEFRSRLDAITTHVANMHQATRFRVEMGRQQASYVAQLQNIRDMLGSLQEQIRALYASLQRLPELPAVSGRPAAAAAAGADGAPALGWDGWESTARRSGATVSSLATRRTLLRRGARHRSRVPSRVYRSSQEGTSSSDPPSDPPAEGETPDFGDGSTEGASRTRPLASHFCPRRRESAPLRSGSRPFRNTHVSLRCAHYRLQHSLARCDQLTRQTQHQVMAAERQIRHILRQVAGSEPLTAEQLRRRVRAPAAASRACRQCGGQPRPGSAAARAAASSRGGTSCCLRSRPPSRPLQAGAGTAASGGRAERAADAPETSGGRAERAADAPETSGGGEPDSETAATQGSTGGGEAAQAEAAAASDDAGTRMEAEVGAENAAAASSQATTSPPSSASAARRAVTGSSPAADSGPASLLTARAAGPGRPSRAERPFRVLRQSVSDGPATPDQATDPADPGANEAPPLYPLAGEPGLLRNQPAGRLAFTGPAWARAFSSGSGPLVTSTPSEVASDWLRSRAPLDLSASSERRPPSYLLRPSSLTASQGRESTRESAQSTAEPGHRLFSAGAGVPRPVPPPTTPLTPATSGRPAFSHRPGDLWQTETAAPVDDWSTIRRSEQESPLTHWIHNRAYTPRGSSQPAAGDSARHRFAHLLEHRSLDGAAGSTPSGGSSGPTTNRFFSRRSSSRTSLPPGRAGSGGERRWPWSGWQRLSLQRGRDETRPETGAERQERERRSSALRRSLHAMQDQLLSQPELNGFFLPPSLGAPPPVEPGIDGWLPDVSHTLWAPPPPDEDLPRTLRRRELGGTLPRSVRPLLADLPAEPGAVPDSPGQGQPRDSTAPNRRVASALSRLDRALARELPGVDTGSRPVDGGAAGDDTVAAEVAGSAAQRPATGQQDRLSEMEAAVREARVAMRSGVTEMPGGRAAARTERTERMLRRLHSSATADATDPEQVGFRRNRNRMLLADFLAWRRRSRRSANSGSGSSGGASGGSGGAAAAGGCRSGGEAAAEVGHRLGLLLDAARVVEQRAAGPERRRPPRRHAADQLTTPARARHLAWQLRSGQRPPPAGSPVPSPLRTGADPLLSAGQLPANDEEADSGATPRIEVTGPASSTPTLVVPPGSLPPRSRPGQASSWASLAGGSGSGPSWPPSVLDRAAGGELPDVVAAVLDYPDHPPHSDGSPIINRRVLRGARREPADGSTEPPPPPYRFRPYAGLSAWNPTSANMGVAGGGEVFGPMMGEAQPGDALGGYDSLMQVIGYPGYPCVSHRLQAWDFSALQIPDMTDERRNLVCSRCKVHNDATVDISQDGRRLAAIVPESHPSTAVCVFSLESVQLGRLLYRVSLGINTISVSLSPRGRHLVVGLAARRMVALPAESQVMAQIYCLDENSAELVLNKDLLLNSGDMPSRYVSINCIRWLPTPGAGLIFGTNRGKLVMLK